MVKYGFAEPCQRSVVEGEPHQQEGDERPYFFGVPTPVAPPRLICPDGANEDTCAHQECRRVHEQFAGFLHPLDIRRSVRFFTADAPHNKRCNAVERHKST